MTQDTSACMRVGAQVSQVIEERVAHLKKELDDAAVKTNRTLYANLAVSVAGALGMAVIGLVCKKLFLGELDLFATFRVLLLAAAAATGVFFASPTPVDYANT